MTVFPYALSTDTQPTIGLIVLQTDERIEQDFRRLLPSDVSLFASRVPSGQDVTTETLQQMEHHVPAAAALLPGAAQFDAIGYGCTSGTAQIGQARIAELVRQGARTPAVSDPLTALVAACSHLGLKRLAFLSPYIEDVSDRLRDVLRGQGVQTPAFGTFAEAEEAKVVRISQQSIHDAAIGLAQHGGVDGIFLSCTNLNTLDVIAPIEAETGLPVLSSNLVLGWHLCQLAGAAGGLNGQGRLLDH